MASTGKLKSWFEGRRAKVVAVFCDLSICSRRSGPDGSVSMVGMQGLGSLCAASRCQEFQKSSPTMAITGEPVITSEIIH